mgnify:CR=1 FL=1
MRTHKLKGVLTLTPVTKVEENINSAGDLMSFTLSVPSVGGKLVVQRSVFSYDEVDESGDRNAQSARIFEPGFIDPLSKFVQCLRNSIALLRKKPEMEGVLKKLPMSGRRSGKGEQLRYFTLQGPVLRYYSGGSHGDGREHFHVLKGSIGLTKECELSLQKNGKGFSLQIPGEGTLVASSTTARIASMWFDAINAALVGSLSL